MRNIDAIRRACLQLAPDAAVEGLHGVWSAWLTRAKRAVVRWLESDAQTQLFFYLFHPHRRSETEPGRDAPQACRQAS